MLHAMSAMLESHTKGGVEVFNLPAQASGDDLAVLQYTGGTTGLSKGAMLTHANLISNVHDATASHDFTGDDVSLSVLPLARSARSPTQ